MALRTCPTCTTTNENISIRHTKHTRYKAYMCENDKTLVNLNLSRSYYQNSNESSSLITFKSVLIILFLIFFFKQNFSSVSSKEMSL